MAMWALLRATLIAGLATATYLPGIPTLPFKTVNSTNTFDVYAVHQIHVDPRLASKVDEAGWTLIPPTLQQFAETFADDLQDLNAQTTHVTGKVSVTNSDFILQTPSIRLTLGNSTNFRDAAGRWTSEGYKIDVTNSSLTVTGASPLGVWWATRSILQQAVLKKGNLSLGSGIDAPGWNTRGIFVSYLDISF